MGNTFRIEWWLNTTGHFNWHAVSNDNGQVLWGSVQGYDHKDDLLTFVAEYFPGSEVRRIDESGQPA